MAVDSWRRCCATWASMNGFDDDLSNLDPEVLNMNVELFFAEIEEDEPYSMETLRAAVERFLRRNYEYVTQKLGNSLTETETETDT